MVLLIPIVII